MLSMLTQQGQGHAHGLFNSLVHRKDVVQSLTMQKEIDSPSGVGECACLLGAADPQASPLS
jgi:hypothetical protein